jgi:hypothetical protein
MAERAVDILLKRIISQNAIDGYYQFITLKTLSSFVNPSTIKAHPNL